MTVGLEMMAGTVATAAADGLFFFFNFLYHLARGMETALFNDVINRGVGSEAVASGFCSPR